MFSISIIMFFKYVTNLKVQCLYDFNCRNNYFLIDNRFYNAQIQDYHLKESSCGDWFIHCSLQSLYRHFRAKNKSKTKKNTTTNNNKSKATKTKPINQPNNSKKFIQQQSHKQKNKNLHISELN